MNLETALPASLWEAIRVNYEKRDYTAAILDCCYFVSELLRLKSGSDGDGIPLVGQALGGTSPKIRIAKDQSETEQNIQKGIESILRGFYQAIRNPRSHKKIIDSAEDGVSIILFCGYLVKQLEQAKALASKESFIHRALDKDFVPNDNYAQLLLKEIPSRLRLEVFFGVYESKESWNISSIKFFNKNLISQLDPHERSIVIDTVSDDLKILDDDKIVGYILGGMPAAIWTDIAQIARLRIEHKVVKSIRDGRYDSKAQRYISGALATCSKRQFPYFILKSELILTVARKLWSSDSQERGYAFEFHSNIFSAFELSDLSPLHGVFTNRLKLGNEEFYSHLQWEPTEKWSNEMKSAYENFSAKRDDTLDDEMPF